MLRAMVVLALVAGGGAARAQDKPAAEKPAPSSPSSSQPSDMNFDLFGDKEHKSPLDEAREKDRIAKLEKRVRLRRALLKWHQALGFVTLGALAVTDILGTLNYVDKYGGGNLTGTNEDAHVGVAISTTVIFGTTGILALAAPNPYPKPVKFDAALVHKLSMAMAAACFVTQVILGPVTESRGGHLDQRDFALAHLVVGYGAFAFMGAGVLAYVF